GAGPGACKNVVFHYQGRVDCRGHPIAGVAPAHRNIAVDNADARHTPARIVILGPSAGCQQSSRHYPSHDHALHVRPPKNSTLSKACALPNSKFQIILPFAPKRALRRWPKTTTTAPMKPC